MAVVVGDDIHRALRVGVGDGVAGGVARNHPGGNAHAPQQHRHRRAEVFAVTLPAVKQEIVHAVGAKGGRIDGQVVGVVVFQIGFHRFGLVVGGGGVGGDAGGQRGHAGRHIRGQRRVARPDPGGVVGAGGAQVVRLGSRYRGGDAVGDARIRRPARRPHRQHIGLRRHRFGHGGIEDGAAGIPRHRFQRKGRRQGPGDGMVGGGGVNLHGGADGVDGIRQG